MEEIANERPSASHFFSNFYEIGVDILSRNNYNKCVTESEVKICPHAQGDQRQKTRKKFGLVFGLTWKQRKGSKLTA